jgi:cell division protease FtsH
MRTYERRLRHYTSPAKPGPPKEPPRPGAPPPPPRWRSWLLLIGILLTFLLLFVPAPSTKKTTTLNYSQFVSKVDGNEVKTASINPSGAVTGELKNGDNYESQIPTALNTSQLSASLQQHKVTITGVGSSTSAWTVILAFLPLVLFIALFIWLGRSSRRLAGGIMGIGGSRAKVYQEDRPSTRFSDVAGYEGAKREVAEVVDFLKDPAKYQRVGAVGPRGVLMVGPPGSGKTLMARAVAGEASVPFLALTGSSFVELFVGVGASRVRDLFAQARKLAPSIIFIDEIDAIGQRRGGSIVSNDEREQTLNQMLAEMDGFDPSTGVVVMAATNRPEILDPALLRPGRFDREVEIPLPNQAERKAILIVHIRGKRVHPKVDLERVARGTPGFSGADLANLVNEAAISAVREGREEITDQDLDAARDRVILGRRDDSNALLPEEKHSVAVHEAGHALVALSSEHADPVAKITILPAGRALGATEQLPVDERHLYAESYLLDSLAIRLGGRASELLVIGEASTGAANDLSGATELAVHMVRDWGLSPRLGPVGYGSDGPGYLGGAPQQARQYAEGTQQVIDEEVTRLLNEAEDRARSLLSDNRRALDAVVKVLLEKETISGEELAQVVDHTKHLEPQPEGSAPSSTAPSPTPPHQAPARTKVSTGTSTGSKPRT